MKQFLQGVQGVDIYLIISMFIFMGIFVVVLIRLFFSKKGYYDEIKKLPFSDESKNLTKNESI